MRLALDTNRYTDLANAVPGVVATLQQASSIVMPFITIAELRGGFAMGRQGRANEQFLQASSTGLTCLVSIPMQRDHPSRRSGLQAAPDAGDADPDERHVARCPGPPTRADAVRA